MATQLFANNAASTLAAAITAGATSLTVQTGDGALFPSPGAGEYAILTLQSGTTVEVIKYTARSSDTISSITRAQESTSASAFAAGSRVELRVTAATLNLFTQGGAGDDFDTGGGAITTGTGDIDSEGGDILAGGGLIDSEGGEINAGGADVNEVDELILNSGGAASAAGRLRRNGTDLTWHDGTAARTLAVLAGVGAVGLRLAATSTAEATTATGSAADIKAITVSATTSEMLLLIASLRKSAGAGVAAEWGLKVNATQCITNAAWTNTDNAAANGLLVCFIGRQTANYLKAGGAFVLTATVPVAFFNIGTDLPAASITSLTITGSSASASVTMGVADAFVYRFVMA